MPIDIECIVLELEAFFSAMFPNDPKIWVTEVAPIGALRSWLERDIRTQIPAYVTSEVLCFYLCSQLYIKLCQQDVREWRDALCEDIVLPALCWYKVVWCIIYLLCI